MAESDSTDYALHTRCSETKSLPRFMMSLILEKDRLELLVYTFRALLERQRRDDFKQHSLDGDSLKLIETVKFILNELRENSGNKLDRMTLANLCLPCELSGLVVDKTYPKTVRDLCSILLEDLCLPIIMSFATVDDVPVSLQMVDCVLSLSDLCCAAASEALQNLYISNLVEIFHILIVTNESKRVIGSVIDALANFFNCDSVEKVAFNQLLEEIKTSLAASNEPIVGHILVKLIPILDNNIERFMTREDFLIDMWEITDKCWSEESSNNLELSVRRGFFIFCGLSHLFFPAGGFCEFSQRLVSNNKFWKGFQLGFIDNDSVTRKRALFLLKLLLDVTTSSTNNMICSHETVPVFDIRPGCQQKMNGVWHDFFLLIETLEETQSHVIKPVLTRFDHIVNASGLGGTEAPAFHSSWLFLLFRRALMHESLIIRRWSLTKLLSLDYTRINLENPTEFFSGPFISMLLDTAAYYRPDDEVTEESENPLILALHSFFPNIQKAIHPSQQTHFWESFFKSLSVQHWNGVLFYVARALLDVSPAPLLNHNMVSVFRSLLTTCLVALNTQMRSAVQCFLMNIFVRLSNLSEISFPDLATLIGCLKNNRSSFWRGCSLWCHLVDWLKCTVYVNSSFENWQPEIVGNILKNRLASWLQNSDEIVGSCDALLDIPECCATVRLLLLSTDAGLLVPSAIYDDPAQRKMAALREHLSPLIQILSSVGSHVYMPEVKVHRAFITLAVLLKESEMGKTSKPDDEIQQVISLLLPDVLNEILIFVSRKLSSLNDICEYSSVQLYFSLLSLLGPTNKHGFLLESPIFQQLINNSIAILLDKSDSQVISKVASMEFLGLTCDLFSIYNKESIEQNVATLRLRDFVQRWNVHVDFSKNFCDTNNQSTVMSKIWSDFIVSQWKCISWFVHDQSSLSLDVTRDYVDSAERTIDIASSDGLLLCFDVLALLLPKIPDEGAVVTLSVAWDRVLELLRKSTFRSVYKAFLDIAFQPEFLNRPQTSEIIKFLIKCFSGILQKSEEKSGMLNLLICRLCDCFRVQPDLLSNMNIFAPCFARALTFGTVCDKAKRFLNKARQELAKDKNLAEDFDIQSRGFDDASARIELLSMLSRMRASDPKQLAFGWNLVKELMSLHQSTFERTQRCYGNSAVHRLRHRTVVGLFFLEEFSASNSDAYFEFLMELLNREAQPSVRFLAEWMLIRQISLQPNLFSVVLNRLKDSSNWKASVVCSVLVVITHAVQDICSHGCNQEAPVLQALSAILPWCMVSHFNTRVFAQASLVQIWRCVREHHLGSATSTSSMIETVERFISGNKDTFHCPLKLLENYCFKFHPQRDWSVESLVYDVPRLTGMTIDEWLAPDRFTSVDPTWHQTDERRLPLTSSNVLHHCQAGIWKTKPTESGGGDQERSIESLTGDVQKKVIPWRAVLPQPIADERDGTASIDEGLVLVTSLIDRIPNLGGLCRTSEIFGISKFIIGNMRFLEDKNFETLSVTSQKWIPIDEVTPNRLQDYLLEMKRLGYTLIGAEQTSKSRCLTEFRFPKKSLLILGNERQGIPVHLIQLLDECVEIPQRGIVRSLNVHVSGAILIWEYYKQWLFGCSPNDASRD